FGAALDEPGTGRDGALWTGGLVQGVAHFANAAGYLQYFVLTGLDVPPDAFVTHGGWHGYRENPCVTIGSKVGRLHAVELGGLYEVIGAEGNVHLLPAVPVVVTE